MESIVNLTNCQERGRIEHFDFEMRHRIPHERIDAKSSFDPLKGNIYLPSNR